MAQGNGSTSQGGTTTQERTSTIGQGTPSSIPGREMGAQSRDPDATPRESIMAGRDTRSREDTSHKSREPSRETSRLSESRETGRMSEMREGREVEEMKDHFGILRQDFVDLRRDLMAALESLFEAGKEKSGMAKDKIVEGSKRAVDATETQIKERPFLSVVLALIFGMILAKVFESKRS